MYQTKSPTQTTSQIMNKRCAPSLPNSVNLKKQPLTLSTRFSFKNNNLPSNFNTANHCKSPAIKQTSTPFLGNSLQFHQKREDCQKNNRKRFITVGNEYQGRQFMQNCTQKKKHFMQFKENIMPDFQKYSPLLLSERVYGKEQIGSQKAKVESSPFQQNQFNVSRHQTEWQKTKNCTEMSSPNSLILVKPFDLSNYQSSKEVQQILSNHKKKPILAISDLNIDLTSSFIFDESSCKANIKSSKEILESDFIKLKYLGKGKFGSVHLVLHKKTNFICAMKIISKNVVKEEKVEHQIVKQLKIHNSLKHLNIIDFYGFFEDKNNIFILIQYGTGGQLYSKLKQCHRMEQKSVIPIIQNVVEGLRMMHNMGFIHRDIKPENLILQFNSVKICDLGWSTDCSFSQTRKSSCGTPLYYSPQMIRKQQYNYQVDVWSIGILTYELLVGRGPFKIWSEFDLNLINEEEVKFPDYIDISANCEQFIRQCLCKYPSSRIKLEDLRRHPFLANDLNLEYFNGELYHDVQRVCSNKQSSMMQGCAQKSNDILKVYYEFIFCKGLL